MIFTRYVACFRIGIGQYEFLLKGGIVPSIIHLSPGMPNHHWGHARFGNTPEESITP